jgi:hypothetical protein
MRAADRNEWVVEVPDLRELEADLSKGRVEVLDRLTGPIASAIHRRVACQQYLERRCHSTSGSSFSSSASMSRRLPASTARLKASTFFRAMRPASISRRPACRHGGWFPPLHVRSLRRRSALLVRCGQDEGRVSRPPIGAANSTRSTSMPNPRHTPADTARPPPLEALALLEAPDAGRLVRRRSDPPRRRRDRRGAGAAALGWAAEGHHTSGWSRSRRPVPRPRRGNEWRGGLHAGKRQPSPPWISAGGAVVTTRRRENNDRSQDRNT